MSSNATFDQVLDAVEQLPDELQLDLVDVVRRRLAERGRDRVVRDAHEATSAFDAGQLKPMSVDQIMSEIES